MERARKRKDKERIVGTELHQWREPERGENNFAEQLTHLVLDYFDAQHIWTLDTLDFDCYMHT